MCGCSEPLEQSSNTQHKGTGVDTEVTYFAAPACRRTNSMVSRSLIAPTTPLLPPGMQIKSRGRGIGIKDRPTAERRSTVPMSPGAPAWQRLRPARRVTGAFLPGLVTTAFRHQLDVDLAYLAPQDGRG